MASLFDFIVFPMCGTVIDRAKRQHTSPAWKRKIHRPARILAGIPHDLHRSATSGEDFSSKVKMTISAASAMTTCRSSDTTLTTICNICRPL